MARFRIPAALNGFWGPWSPAGTPGPAGHNDHGDPLMCTPLGDTPGSIGMWDAGDFSLPIIGSGEICMPHGLVRTRDGQVLSLGAEKEAPEDEEEEESESGELTQEKLKILFPQAPDSYLAEIVEELNTDLAAYCLETSLRQAHFFGQLMEESGPRIQAKVENLNYSPEALMKFSYYKQNPTEAKTDGYTKDPKTAAITKKADTKAIANKAYGNRMGNGAPATGDGYKYRGRGLIQVTGKENYAAVTKQYSELYDDDTIDFVNKPDLMTEFPYTLRSAVCYWTMNRLHLLADRGKTPQDVDRITRVINSATDSYGERQKNFASALDALT